MTTRPWPPLWRPFQATVAADAALRADYAAVAAEHGRAQTQKGAGRGPEPAHRVRAGRRGRRGGGLGAAVWRALFPSLPGWRARPNALQRSRGSRRPCWLAGAQALGGASAKTLSAKGVELEQARAPPAMPGALFALLTQERHEPRKFGDKTCRHRRRARRAGRGAALCWPPAQHAAWLHQQRMARLTRCLLAEYAALKRERGWVDMNDIERAALVLLGDPVLSRLGAGAAGRARQAPADRRVPGHQPAAVAGAARLAVGLRRRGRAGAQRVHRGRPQAEHLPLPPRRAAGVQGGAGLRARRPGRRPAELRPHPAQRARPSSAPSTP